MNMQLNGLIKLYTYRHKSNYFIVEIDKVDIFQFS